MVALRTVWAVILVVASVAITAVAADQPAHSPLDPRGQVHLPIGLPNTVDQLKTFVEAEGNFSPGFGSCGIYFWVWDDAAKRLFAPTMDDVKCAHGLAPGSLLIPWSRWRAGEVEVTTEVGAAQVRIKGGEVLIDDNVAFQRGWNQPVVAARVRLINRGARAAKLSLFAALRPLGPAGGRVPHLAAGGDSLQQLPFTALHSERRPTRSGVLLTDTIGEWALRGETPTNQSAQADSGRCSGALVFDLTLPPGAEEIFGFVCPVMEGRRVVGHKWDGVSSWAQYDLHPPPAPQERPLAMPDRIAAERSLTVDRIFRRAAASCSNVQQRVRLALPDPRWAEAFAAIVGHSALCLNEGAPDVSVINYNVYNRDGMYLANIFQKSGNDALAETAIDYFLQHPFNGRVQPEADNPGQILWVMGEHWQFTRNRAWLRRVYPSVQKLAAMVRYYRTTPGPHWVSDTSLDFGEALPANQRKELKPGACDGFNPNYTEAYDIAGLRAAAGLAEALAALPDTNGRALADAATAEAEAWRALADELFVVYEKKFRADLPKGYGSYSVLWPCRLYPFGEGPAHEQFKNVGAQQTTNWRYFPLARAHQGLLAGRRDAAWRTLATHLDHEQMRGWYAFDEGGPSGVGGWHHLAGFSSWPVHPKGEGNHAAWAVAMPHGWAIAEFHLLLRDALAFEDGNQLVLLAGVPPEWFRHPTGMKIENLPIHFGRLFMTWTRRATGAGLELSGATPPGGFLVRLPAGLATKARFDGGGWQSLRGGDVAIPPKTRAVQFE